MDKEVMEDVKPGSTVAVVKSEPVFFAEPGMKISGDDYQEDLKGKSIDDDPVGMESIDEIKIEYVKISVINGYDESDASSMDVNHERSKIDPPMPRTSMRQETLVDGTDTRGTCTDEIEIEEFKLEPIDESYDSDEDKVADVKPALKDLEEISPCLKQHLDGHDTPLVIIPEANLTKAPSYVCDQCDKSFINQPQLKSHQRCHKRKQCPICMAKVSYFDFKRHLDRHDAPRVSCEMCDKSFKAERYLKKHIALQHTPDANLAQDETYECDQCNRSFDNQLQLKIHQRCHKLKQCPICMVEVSYSKFRQHIDGHASRMSCEICDKSFKSNKYLKRHIAVQHTQDTNSTKALSYECDQCDRSFINQLQLKNHQRCHKLKQCPKCPAKVSYSNFKLHLDRHDAPRAICETCDKSFKSKFDLKRHIAVQHTTDTDSAQGQSYECDQCNRSFSNQLQLKSHQRCHKLKQCPICMAKVSYSNFKLHLDRHDAPLVSCETCDKSFKSKLNLKRHIALRHNPDTNLAQDQTYECDQCNESFDNQLQLSSHQLSHELKQCPKCNRKVSYSNFKRHLDRHDTIQQE